MDNKREKVVSIVIPVYNVEKFLRECINSVISQTYRNLDIVLVDDGSTDKSGVICDQYELANDRISVIHQENRGLSAARNTGMDASIGEYIYFLDSDDYLEPNAIERLVQTIEEEKADMVFFDAYVIFTDCDDDGSVGKYRRNKKYQTKNGKTVLLELYNNDEYRTPVQLYFYRLAWIKEKNLKFFENIIHEDELFSFQAFMADGVVAHCHEALYARRIRPASIMTSSSFERRFASILAIFLELDKMYRRKAAEGEAADKFLLLFAKSVYSRYQLLSEDQKKIYLSDFEGFRKIVILNKGFGDVKLLEKCSSGVRKMFYQIKRKVFRR